MFILGQPADLGNKHGVDLGIATEQKLAVKDFATEQGVGAIEHSQTHLSVDRVLHRFL